MVDKERKFMFDINIFDAPDPDELKDLPPPPPTFSEEELAGAKDMAFEQGRLEGIREQKESREQFIATSLSKIADSFSRLFAAEKIRESVYEKESLRLAIMTLDLLFPLMNERLGREDVLKVIENTLIQNRKTKEISIQIPQGMGDEISTLIDRIRDGEHEETIWRIIENPSFTAGDCILEWSDGGAIRDTTRAAQMIRSNIESLLQERIPPLSEHSQSDVNSQDKKGESPQPNQLAPVSGDDTNGNGHGEKA